MRMWPRKRVLQVEKRVPMFRGLLLKVPRYLCTISGAPSQRRFMSSDTVPRLVRALEQSIEETEPVVAPTPPRGWTTTSKVGSKGDRNVSRFADVLTTFCRVDISQKNDDCVLAAGRH